MVTTPTLIRNRTDPIGDDPLQAYGPRTLNLRRKCRVATWNVQTLLRTGYTELLSKELSSYNISLVGLCETRWRDSGEKTVDGYHYIWSGPKNNNGLYGVALALPTRLKSTVISWKPISSRLLAARLQHHHGKMTVIVGYAPTNVATDDTKDAYYEQLHRTVEGAPPHDIILVLTDANATISADARDPSLRPVVGPELIDSTTNDNGHRMIDLCRAENLCIIDSFFPRKRIHHYTWYSGDGRTKKALDHILISTRWKSFVTNCRVYRGAQLANTDHRLLAADLKLKLKTQRSTSLLPRLNTARLREPALEHEYACSITNRFNGIEFANDWDTFKVAITEATTETLGLGRPPPKQPWISEQTLDIINLRREARLRGDMEEYRHLNERRNAAIRQDKETYWENQATLLEEASQRNDLRQTYALLKKSKADPDHRTTLIKDSQGNVLSTETECIARWKEHFSELLNHPPVPDNPDLIADANNNTAPNPQCETSPVTANEVRNALKKLKNFKAPGVCGITAEMIKHGGNTIVLWLVEIINWVWVHNTLPNDWRKGIILPFWKGKGDQLVCKNHRGITLLSIPGKLFTRILLTRALPAIRSRRRPQQAGFMPNRSTTDHISALRLMVEKAREFRKNRHLYIAFVDLRAAFDTIDHGSLWKILQVLGTPPKLVSLFQQLYCDAESSVRINGKLSDSFTINSGVRQGCVAAPDLFNSVIDYLMTKVTARIAGMPFGSYDLGDLEYADDTALITGTLEDIIRALDIFDEEARKLGLVINWDKTELMHVGDGPDPQPLLYDGTEVKFVPKFKYLGSIITNTGDLRPEIDRRRALATSAMKALARPLWNQRTISRKTKLRIYNSTVLAILLYGAETWPLNKTLSTRIDGFDSRALRQIERIFWPQRITNDELRAITQQPPASRLAAMRRVRWYGHLQRLPPQHPTKAMLDFDPGLEGWRRPRGAPRTRWLDVVTQDLQLCGITIADAQQLAQDRPAWRRLVTRVGSTLPEQEG